MLIANKNGLFCLSGVLGLEQSYCNDYIRNTQAKNTPLGNHNDRQYDNLGEVCVPRTASEVFLSQ